MFNLFVDRWTHVMYYMRVTVFLQVFMHCFQDFSKLKESILLVLGCH